MGIITTIATARGTTEARVANDMTYRQMEHVGQTMLKEKMLVLSSIAHSLKGIGSKEKKVGKGAKTSLPGGLPSWFKTRKDFPPAKNVVDLDGPLGFLMPFIGGIGSLGKKR